MLQLHCIPMSENVGLSSDALQECVRLQVRMWRDESTRTRALPHGFTTLPDSRTGPVMQTVRASSAPASIACVVS